MRAQVLALLVTLACLADSAPYRPYLRPVRPFYRNNYYYDPYLAHDLPYYDHAAPYHVYRAPAPFRYRPVYYSGHSYASPAFYRQSQLRPFKPAASPVRSPLGVLALVPRPQVQPQSDVPQNPAFADESSNQKLLELFNVLSQDERIEQLAQIEAAKQADLQATPEQEKPVYDDQQEVYSPVSQEQAATFESDRESFSQQFPYQLDSGSQADLESLVQSFQATLGDAKPQAEISPAAEVSPQAEDFSQEKIAQPVVVADEVPQASPVAPEVVEFQPISVVYNSGAEQPAEGVAAQQDEVKPVQEVAQYETKEAQAAPEYHEFPEAPQEVPFVLVKQQSFEQVQQEAPVPQAAEEYQVDFVQQPVAQPAEVAQEPVVAEAAEEAVAPQEAVSAFQEPVVAKVAEVAVPPEVAIPVVNEPVVVEAVQEAVKPQEVVAVVQEPEIEAVEAAKEVEAPHEPVALVQETAVQAEEPVQEEVAQLVEPVAVPQEFAEPAAQPVEAVAVAQDFAEPAAQPVEAVAVAQDFAEPAAQPVEPIAVVQEYAEPAAQPVEAIAVAQDFAEPAAQPVEPVAVAQEFSEPAAQPVEAIPVAQDFAEPAAQPVEPVAVAQEFSEPAAQPIEPIAVVQEYAEADAQPIEPIAVAQEFVEAAAQPVEPVALAQEFAEPAAQPVEAVQDYHQPEADQRVQAEPEVVAHVQDSAEPIAAKPEFVAQDPVPVVAEHIPFDQIKVAGFDEPAPQPVAESQVAEDPKPSFANVYEELTVESAPVQIGSEAKADPKPVPLVVAIPERVQPEPQPVSAARISSECRIQYEEAQKQAAAELAAAEPAVVQEVHPVVEEKKPAEDPKDTFEALPVVPAVVEEVQARRPPSHRNRLTLIFNPRH